MWFIGNGAPRVSEADRAGGQAGVRMLPIASGVSTEGQQDPLSTGEDWQVVEGKGSPFLQELRFSSDTQGHRAGLREQNQMVTERELWVCEGTEKHRTTHNKPGGFVAESGEMGFFFFPLSDFPKDAESL